MKTLLLVATALAFGTAAHAAPQISIGGSTSGVATFQGTGTGNLNVSLGAISGTATDSVSPGAGTYTMTAFGPVLATAVGSGVWDFSASDTFTYVNGANSVTETLTYQSVNDGSANPHFAGVDSVTAISGSAAFVSTFGGIGRGSTFDFAVDSLPSGTTLDLLANSTASITSGISSGQLNPNPPPSIPEPSTLAVFGLGIAGLFAARRLTRRKAT